MLIIFDLDGTLIDSSQDLAVSTNATRHFAGLPPLTQDVISSFVGNGAAMLVRRALGPDAPEKLVEESLAFFLKYYRAHSLEHTTLYPGIRQLLDALKDSGHTLAVLTNKPFRISRDILAALEVSGHFSKIYGGDSLAAKKPDPIGITTLMQETGANPMQTIMVGDSKVDVQTARNAGVRSCGVGWGFQPESFLDDPPDFVIEGPQELLFSLNESAPEVEFPRSRGEQALQS